MRKKRVRRRLEAAANRVQERDESVKIVQKVESDCGYD
jgi:hypothetical protein